MTIKIKNPIPTIYLGIDLKKTEKIHTNPFIVAAIIHVQLKRDYPHYAIYTKPQSNQPSHIIDIHNAHLLGEDISIKDKTITYPTLMNKIECKINEIITNTKPSDLLNIDADAILSESLKRHNKLELAYMKTSELNTINLDHIKFKINHADSLQIYAINEKSEPTIALNPNCTLYALRKTAISIDRLISSAITHGQDLQIATSLAHVTESGTIQIPELTLADFKEQESISEMIQSLTTDLQQADTEDLSDHLEDWIWVSYIDGIHTGIIKGLLKDQIYLSPV